MKDKRKNKINNKKRKLSIHKIMGLILFITSIIFGAFITMLDVLPTKYFSIMVVVLILINFIVDIFLFKKKIKKYKKNIACGFAVIFTIFMIIISSYLYKTLDFLWGIGSSDYKMENYSVIVLNDNKYQKIDDLEDLKVGYYINTTGAENANNELSKVVDVEYVSYNNLDTFANDLIESNVDAILVEDAILKLLYEENEDLEKSVCVIYNFTIKIKINNNAKDVNVVKEPFNVYITGIDTYGDISSVSRSDVNIVMTVNPNTKQILLTSIPRDYYVQLHGKKGSKDKLTHAGMYGVDMSIATIEDLLGVEINYYVKVNFTSFIDIVDALGGIEVYSKYTFTSKDNFNYTKGYNKMNGEQALSFARERKAFAEGDRQRGANQQSVIEAVIRKACSKAILTKYDSLLSSIDGEFETNISQKKITALIKMQLNDMSSWTVTSINLNGSDGYGITYTGGNQELYVMMPNEDSVKEASDLIKLVMDGEKLEGSYELSNGKSSNVTKSGTNKNSTTANKPSSNSTNKTNTNKDEKNTMNKTDDSKVDGNNVDTNKNSNEKNSSDKNNIKPETNNNATNSNNNNNSNNNDSNDNDLKTDDLNNSNDSTDNNDEITSEDSSDNSQTETTPDETQDDSDDKQNVILDDKESV